jgi:acetylglutamate kinase
MNALHKAEALVEALDYFRAFRKKIVVVKLGGSIMDDSSCLTSTLADLVLMETAGMLPVLVHGGGKAIDQAMAKQGLQPKKIAGRRITDDDTLAIVRDVLTNETNADIVRRIRNLGGRAIPLHTGAMQVLWGKKWLLPTENGFTDLGHVGIVDKVDNNLISDFISAGVIPVIPSLAIDDKNSWLNVNADTAACAVAMSLKAEKLVFLSDTPGILRDRKDPSSLITSLNQKDCQELIKQGIIDSGMIPKVEACLDSLQKGVGKTHMIDGRQKHSLLLEIFTKQGTGTEITLN